MTVQTGTSFVALNKHIRRVFFGCEGQKPNLSYPKLDYLSNITRKLRVWLDQEPDEVAGVHL